MPQEHVPDVAVVLGTGIAGAALAQRLAGTHRIIVVDSEAAKAEAAAAAVTAAGGTARAVALDLANLAAVQEFAAQVSGTSRVGLVAHLVGGWRGSPGLDAEAIAAYAALEVPLIVTVQNTSVAFRDAIAASGGRFAMVTSTAKPTAGNAAYATAKAAAEVWLRALAHSLGDTDAAACVFAVKALVSDDMRAANPAAAYAGYTDVRDLANAIADSLGQRPDPATPAWIRRDLTVDA